MLPLGRGCVHTAPPGVCVSAYVCVRVCTQTPAPTISRGPTSSPTTTSVPTVPTPHTHTFCVCVFRPAHACPALPHNCPRWCGDVCMCSPVYVYGSFVQGIPLSAPTPIPTHVPTSSPSLAPTELGNRTFDPTLAPTASEFTPSPCNLDTSLPTHTDPRVHYLMCCDCTSHRSVHS